VLVAIMRAVQKRGNEPLLFKNPFPGIESIDPRGYFDPA
jgi:hypothetical protein